MFARASRTAARARILLYGASGSGKTYSALLLACGLGEKTALIDSEAGSGSLYADLMEYDTTLVDVDGATCKQYMDAIAEAAQSGYGTLIIDGITPFWDAIKDQANKEEKKGKKTFQIWGDLTPVYRRLVTRLLSYPGHIIVTCRAKTEYLMEDYIDRSGAKKVKPTKIGLTPDFRQGFDYEFSTVIRLDQEHHAHVEKDRLGVIGTDYLESIDSATGNRLVKGKETKNEQK